MLLCADEEPNIYLHVVLPYRASYRVCYYSQIGSLGVEDLIKLLVSNNSSTYLGSTSLITLSLSLGCFGRLDVNCGLDR